MGTRNLTRVILNGKNVVAQYCQWDGYPDGQGRQLLEFLRKGFNRDKFIERLKITRFISPDEHNALYAKVLGYVPGEWIDWKDGKTFAMAYPTLGRDLGSRVIEFIQKGSISIREPDFSNGKFEETHTLVKCTDEIPLTDNSDFAKDGTWCEWVWTVDLDKGVFIGEGWDMRNEWPLDKLPTVKAMIKAYEREEDEE